MVGKSKDLNREVGESKDPSCACDSLANRVGRIFCAIEGIVSRSTSGSQNLCVTVFCHFSYQFIGAPRVRSKSTWITYLYEDINGVAPGWDRINYIYLRKKSKRGTELVARHMCPSNNRMDYKPVGR